MRDNTPQVKLNRAGWIRGVSARPGSVPAHGGRVPDADAALEIAGDQQLAICTVRKRSQLPTDLARRDQLAAADVDHVQVGPHPVGSAGYERATVGAEGETPHCMLPGRDGRVRLPVLPGFGHLPQPDRRVLAPSRQYLAVRAELRGANSSAV